MKHVYTSIDIGSDTIKIVVCELFHNKLNLLAASSVKSKGIKKGLITDIELAGKSIKQGLTEIEQMLGIKITKVIASVPSYYVDFKIGTAQIEVDGVVTDEDVARLLRLSAENNIQKDNEIVTIVPIDFELDGNKGIRDPKMLEGKDLKIRTVIVSTLKKSVYSVINLLDSLGLEVVDISLNSLGDYYAFKNKDNSSKVGAVVNIGYETTSISLYNKGIIYKSSVLGIGGKNIDNDIAYIYKVDNKEAVKIKEKFALANKKHANSNDYFETTNQMGKSIRINNLEVTEVVASRIEQMLVLIRKEINALTKSEVNYIIITGGTSSVSNFNLTLNEILGNVASVGNIKILGVRHNKYSSAVGNIVYFINKLKLKGQDYTMISEDDNIDLSPNHKGILNIGNESMLGKVFGYFFND